MQKSSKNFVKGLGAGMVAGAAAITVGKMLLKDRQNMTKGSTKMVKAVGEFVDGVLTFFK